MFFLYSSIQIIVKISRIRTNNQQENPSLIILNLAKQSLSEEKIIGMRR